MNKKELLQFYKELYFHELERKDRITAQAQVRFAFVATGVALSAYMLRMLDFTESPTLVWLFLGCLSLALIPFCCSVWVLSRAFWGNHYGYLPVLTDVEVYRQDLEHHYAETGENGSIDNDMLDYLLGSFADISSQNSKVNEARLTKMNHFYRFSLPSVGFFVVASALFIVADLDASSPRKPIVIQQISTPIIEPKLPTELVPNKQELLSND
ncbi:hypothetical protein [Vibrio brasiliensis]|uniref:Uncharacterized protein n=1 Tax=Vibrio brasiliensis LMG 20546 TaxID=945543 RepID=E8LXU4_9VIBR|nr:hypothetical protein [Vibrio brasiliensis]EGA64512.1 hypothetical protein VIBR0546_16903 [Vibrio brasiliensis LMG 20546]